MKMDIPYIGEKQFRLVFENMSEAFALHEIICNEQGEPVDYRFLELNPAFEKLTGLRRSEILGKRVLEVLPKTEQVWIEKYGEVALKGGQIRFENYSAELGRWYEVFSFSPCLSQFAVIFNDITEHKQKEEEQIKQNRTLKALGSSNQVMMRAESQDDYLNQVCSIITNVCGYAMVWIGFARQDEAKTVIPAAQAGFEEGYLRTINITWADTERGRGPTGTAIRTGKPCICRNMISDPDFKPWREEALKRGYASSIVLPLIINNITFGALTIYSKYPDPFSENEVQMLSELAGDLSYGISALSLREEHNKANIALQESEERFRTIAEAAPVLICITRTLDSTVMFTNEVNNKSFGYRGEDIIGKKGPDYYWDPADRVKMMEDFNKKGFVDNLVLKVKKSDGTPFWIMTSVRSINYKGYPAMIGASINITEYKKTEEELQESEARFHSVLDNSLDVIYRLNVQTGRYEYISPSAGNVMGYSISELMAQDVDTALGMVHPDDLASVMEAHRNMESAGVEVEYRQKCRNGSYKWLSNHLSFTRDSEGRPLYRDGSLRDITGRKNAEEELKEKEQRLKFHFENSPLAVVEWDSDFIVIRWSGEAERIFGLKREDVIGRRIDTLNIIYEEDIPIVNGKMERLTSGKEITVISTNSNYTNTGSIIECTWYNSVLLDKNGKMKSVLSLVQDITARVNAQKEMLNAKEAAEKASQAKSRFIANVSHELRTPLNAILGYSQMIRKSVDLNEKQLDGIDVIYNSGRNLLYMINDLLDLSKMEAGKLQLENKEFSLPELLINVSNIINVQAEEKKLKFEFETTSDIPGNVKGDELRLNQVLLNLENGHY
ncbi:MAG: PAS domain S-box protein [Brevinematales bacterium]